MIVQMEVNFMCLFPKNQGIASKSPVGDLTPDGIEQIALWENFDLSFGRQSLSIGDRIRSKHFTFSIFLLHNYPVGALCTLAMLMRFDKSK